MENLNQTCCSKCRHSNQSPCPDFIACRTEGPICHDDDDCSKKYEQLGKTLRREINNKPVIFVGTGTCGLAAGADKTVAALEKYAAEEKLDVEIIQVGCVGLCSAEPLMDILMPDKQRLVFENVTADNAVEIFQGVLGGKVAEDNILGQYTEDGRYAWKGVSAVEDHAFFGPQSRLVLKQCGIVNPASIDEYIARGGYRGFASVIKNMTSEEICDEVETSGLRGRGGGGFPTGKKWKFALSGTADRKYLICNADEGDPGAFMDRAIIEGDPHRLLEGMAIAAYGIRATKAYVYIRAEYPLAITRLEEAISQAREYGILGYNIFDSGMNLEIVIKKGAGAFVCGEETALIHSIEGKRGIPRPRPPFPAVKGLFGKPTIINNVETFSNVPAIAADGAKAFAAIGTETSKGTKVFALSGKVNRTGLIEVEMGTKIRDIIFQIGGGILDGNDYKAVQIGGPSGGCIPEKHLDIEVDYESLKTVGAMMGSGGLVVMDSGTCMVDVAKFFMDFIQRESCGKCIPCREGTHRMLDTLNSITSNTRGLSSLERFRNVLYMERLAESIKDASLCGLGQTAPNPVLSTLRFFRNEYEEHVYERKCPAGVCTDLVNYNIDEDACIGCTACARKCPVGAIEGTPKEAHYIDNETCVGCGVCVTVCKFNAVIKD
ncbi:MAG: NADH-ubiquinone oxidoreductase-F iron-sulfur binding region domain-containing protein [Planctomycetota bacterium]|jgi:NADH:ubiquinone oxidoreductase subunit F (NADH-binding)/ferredoxin/(2Fe-2S) ferredoxin